MKGRKKTFTSMLLVSNVCRFYHRLPNPLPKPPESNVKAWYKWKFGGLYVTTILSDVKTLSVFQVLIFSKKTISIPSLKL